MSVSDSHTETGSARRERTWRGGGTRPSMRRSAAYASSPVRVKGTQCVRRLPGSSPRCKAISNDATGVGLLYHSLPLQTSHQDEQVLFLVPEIATESRFARELRLQVPDLQHEALALLVVLLLERNELLAVPIMVIVNRSSAWFIAAERRQEHSRSAHMALPRVLRLPRLLLLPIELLLEHADLRLRLLLCPLELSPLIPPLLLHPVLLRAERLQVAPEGLGVAADTAEVGLQRSDGASDVPLL
ncbi:hypothetical protein K466DRAFT_334347 [Polyporus arcularius HHB13444]|uniref:Uncharacterized protein n=1 Tax=Polyporus arcularius HHB13444 TaxID=1314778 RepID=A0A5C3NVQ9_9APHY|nr:hypothetical protein K466DRAFT_334347 [Polyporus arcularius HHB13444]